MAFLAPLFSSALPALASAAGPAITSLVNSFTKQDQQKSEMPTKYPKLIDPEDEYSRQRMHHLEALVDSLKERLKRQKDLKIIDPDDSDEEVIVKPKAKAKARKGAKK